MNKKIKVVNDEIDLFKLIQIILDGKWKIVAAIVISIISMSGFVSYYKHNNPKIFTAITEIRPITILKEMDYFYINHIKFYSVNSEFNLPTKKKKILDISEETKEVEKLKFKIDKIFQTSQDFEEIEILLERLNSLAILNSKITEITKLKLKIKEMEDNLVNRNNRIKVVQNFFEFPNIERSELFIYYLETFEPKIFFANAIRKFNLLDIDRYSNEEAYSAAINKLASTVRILKKIDESTGTQYAVIEFRYYDLEKWKTVLKYAGELANKNVKKKLQTRYNKIISIMEKDKDFNIEDISLKINNLIIEIELAKKQNLTTKESATLELFHLEKIKKVLQDDKSIERAKSILETSPFRADNDDFSFASIDISGTHIKPNSGNINSYGLKKMLILAMLIGATIGILYVIVSNQLQFQKKVRKK